MARESRTKYAVLGMLNLGPKCGYDIKKELEKASMFFWNESYGQIYPMLKKLVSSGLATLEVIERKDQPDMKIYTITDDGRHELARWLRQPAEPHPVRNEMLLKLFFGAEASFDMNIAHVQRLKDDIYRHQLKLDDEREDFLEEHGDDDEHKLYWLLTVRYGELMNDALRDWCDEALELIKEKREAAK